MKVTAENSLTQKKWLNRISNFQSVEDIRAWLAERHQELQSDRLSRLIIVGAADEGVRLSGICSERNIRVVAHVDDHPQKQGIRIGTNMVAPLDSLIDIDPEIPVVVASHRVLKVMERLGAMGFRHVIPFGLLETMNPNVFPPHMFYSGLLEDLVDNGVRYQELMEGLADDMSRMVLDAVLGFRLTFDPRILAPIVEWELYGPKNLIQYCEDEVYVDGGAFDGDSVRLFIERVEGKFSRILAFEPDQETYKRLVKNFSGASNVETINAGLHRRKGMLRFDNAGTRGSIFTDTGTVTIPVVGLDEVLGEDRVTFIKMNIEGAEREAIQGGQKAIKSWAPKLGISLYHNPSDLWTIPNDVIDLRPDYKLYMRQHDGGIIETVLYALV
ncbi:MAG: FkbM family methyltransferase [Nitrospira sp.]|nr:FkbM family methyltransferase [Nitrospira sp.]